MPKINRFNGNYRAFASNAENAKRTLFGTTTTGVDGLTENMNSDYFIGWEIVTRSDYPTLQDFNAAFFTSSQTLAYLHQMGVPEWNGNQEYYDGSYATDPNNGEMYRCKTNNHNSNTPPRNDSTNWTRPDAQDADTVDGLHARSFMRKDQTGEITNLDGIYENLIFSFDHDAQGAIGTGTTYDAAGISLNASGQRTQIASIGTGLHVRSNDSGVWKSWKELMTREQFEDEFDSNDLTSDHGFRRLPDGSLEQWGKFAMPRWTNDQYQAFNFSFEECVNVQVSSLCRSGGGGYEVSVGLVDWSNSGLRVGNARVNGSGGDTIYCVWRAIGR